MTQPRPTYEVGYRKPPKATQFQPGRSGNPKGRPKGLVTLASALEAAVSERVVVTENGRSRSLSKLEVVVKQAVNKAASGDLRAMQFVAQLLTLHPLGQPEPAAQDHVHEEDQQLLAGLVDRMQRAARTSLTQLLTQEDAEHEPSDLPDDGK
jgi:hypothetical protein